MIRSLVQNIEAAIRAVLAAGFSAGAVTATTVNGVSILTGTADPTAGGGVAHAHPAIYVRTGTVQVWRSTSATATAWVRLGDTDDLALKAALANPTLAGATVSSSTAPLIIDTGVNEESFFSPTTITGDQTDWNISSPHSAQRFNRYIVTSDASRTINSIAFNVTARRAYWIVNGNTAAGRNITLLHDDGATGTAANRFFCPNLANVVIRPGGAVFVWYDTTAQRHRVMGA